MISNEEKQKIIAHRMKERSKHKRCKYCKYRQNKRKITYLLEESVDWIFYCPWKEKLLSTEWSLGYQGCFCKFYEPKELTIDEI